MSVTGKISQIVVSGSLSQITVAGDISQIVVNGSIVQIGVTHYPPTLVSVIGGATATNQIDVLFDKNLYLYPDLVGLESMFSFSLSGGTVNITGITIPANGGVNKTVVITLDRSLTYGETGTITYTPGTDGLRSEDDESAFVEAFTNSITNAIVGTAPVFVSAAVANATPTKVVLTYDQTLDTGSVPATTDFTVTDHTISSVAISGATVELTLSTAVIYFDIIYVTYTKGANPIQGDVGELDAADLSSTLITNNVAVTGNEIDQWLASDTANITKDGSNYVSSHKGKLNGIDLLQATGSYQPLWISPDYIRFDGVDNFLKSAGFTWNQPEFLILVIRQVTWTNGDRIFDGNATNGGALMQNDSTPELGLYTNGAVAVAQNNNLAVGDWGIVRCTLNGASSKLQINDTAATTGALNTNSMSGLTLGRQGSNALQWSNFEYKEIIGLNIAPSADYETSLYNVVKRRNGL